MATASANFDRYLMWYYSSHTLDAYYDCLIYCYSGSTYVGRIEFLKDATAEDSLKSYISSGRPHVKYRISRFKDVLEILLHENPLYLFVNDTLGIGSIGTADFELTGEEEP